MTQCEEIHVICKSVPLNRGDDRDYFGESAHKDRDCLARFEDRGSACFSMLLSTHFVELLLRGELPPKTLNKLQRLLQQESRVLQPSWPSSYFHILACSRAASTFAELKDN